jgi:hypothetical protein
MIYRGGFFGSKRYTYPVSILINMAQSVNMARASDPINMSHPSNPSNMAHVFSLASAWSIWHTVVGLVNMAHCLRPGQYGTHLRPGQCGTRLRPSFGLANMAHVFGLALAWPIWHTSSAWLQSVQCGIRLSH